MRRKDREVKDFIKICDIIKACDCMRLGLIDRNQAYIVPVNFGYEVIDEKIYFYIHSSKEGRKIDLMLNDDMVTFELDTDHMLMEAGEPCKYSYKYKSVMGRAKVTFLETNDEKSYGLNKLMFHHTGKDNFKFPAIMLSMVRVIKLEVKEISAKEYTE